MSASPIARSLCSTNAQSIPSKKVLINDPNQLPDVYSSTPGGTMYSTTPGGKLSLFIYSTLKLITILWSTASIGIYLIDQFV